MFGRCVPGADACAGTTFMRVRDNGFYWTAQQGGYLPAVMCCFNRIQPNQNSEPYSCGPGLLPDNYRYPALKHHAAAGVSGAAARS
jgi:hypothetical protein